MKEKISKLTERIEEGHRPELSEAFNKLADEVGNREGYPGQTHIDRALEGSIADLEKSGAKGGATDSVLSRKWDQLAEELEEWEEDHPGITLVVGHIARALAAVGL